MLAHSEILLCDEAEDFSADCRGNLMEQFHPAIADNVLPCLLFIKGFYLDLELSCYSQLC